MTKWYPLTCIGLRLTDLDLRLFLVDEYSLECLRASMAVFKLFTKAQLWMALFGKCLNWFRRICPWTTTNLSTLASCIMTVVISTGSRRLSCIIWHRTGAEEMMTQPSCSVNTSQLCYRLSHSQFSQELTVLAHAHHGWARPRAMQSMTFLHIDKEWTW